LRHLFFFKQETVKRKECRVKDEIVGARCHSSDVIQCLGKKKIINHGEFATGFFLPGKYKLFSIYYQFIHQKHHHSQLGGYIMDLLYLI